jgi:sigma-B regulation protein RsbU (phosphoserine phosphatase)
MSDGSNKLLIVDASVQTTDLIAFWLRSEDVQVITSENGANALVKLMYAEPDIAVVNVSLPDMSGFDLCRKLKEEDEDLLVMCISELDNPMYRLRAEQMGADDYIQTDAEQYLFISKIRSLFRLKKLSNQLRLRYTELEEKNAIINKQLELGMQVQRALIPEINTSLMGCKLISRFYPARGIGGDFYNLRPLTEDSFGIVMGDVSGHGIAAAFCTALVNMMMKNLSISDPHPGILLFRLNNELHAMFENSETPLYASVFYAVVDTKQKTVTYSNAGQCFPIHVDAEKNIVRELDITGTPIGLIKDSIYNVGSILYGSSDLMLLHTDGLQDAFYKKQPDEFTRLITELLSEMRNADKMEDVLEAIYDQFYNSNLTDNERLETDDISMILCKLE